MADKGKVCFLFFGIMSTDESFTIRAGTSAEQSKHSEALHRRRTEDIYILLLIPQC